MIITHKINRLGHRDGIAVCINHDGGHMQRTGVKTVVLIQNNMVSQFYRAPGVLVRFQPVCQFPTAGHAFFRFLRDS